MTVPFRPSVLPTPRSQMGGVERFVDTATRAFMEAAGFAEEQREARRRQDEFELRSKLLETQHELTMQEMEAQRRAEAERRAADPRFVTKAEAREPVKPAAPPKRPKPRPGEKAAPPMKAEVSEEIARGIRPGVRATEVPGLFYDPFGEQRRGQQQASFAAQRVQDLLEQYARTPDLPEQQRAMIEEITPQALTMVEAGTPPEQAVRWAISQMSVPAERAHEVLLRRTRPPTTRTTTGRTTTARPRMTLNQALEFLKPFNERVNPKTQEVEERILTPSQLMSLARKVADGSVTEADFAVFDNLSLEDLPVAPPIYAAPPEDVGATGKIVIDQLDYELLLQDGMSEQEIRELYEVPPEVGQQE